jgi:tripartite-type tricarboxylate transporter receptor subunit TctC
MKSTVSRRVCLRLAAGAAALPILSRTASALDYPARPVHIVVGVAAAGPTDIAARLIGQSLSGRLGQNFVVENRTGAATNVATEYVVNSPPDGYTLLTVAPSSAANATLYEHLNFNFLRDIAPVAGIMRLPGVMVVNESVPAKTVPEFIAYAKANPHKINMATAGNGTGPHLFGELFNWLAGVDLVAVAYRGSAPALTDLMSGQCQVMFDALSSPIGYIRADKLRALAVTTATRSPALPDVPTVGEFVPGYEAITWFGLGAPKSTSEEIIDKLNKEVNAGLADPKLKEHMADLGSEPLALTPAGFGKLVADETEKWGKVIKIAKIKPE